MFLPRLEVDRQTRTALNAVDLRLYGGTHGTRTEIDPYGPACVGLIDGDYQGVQNIVGGLKPKRGDVLAIEQAYFMPQYNDDDEWFIDNMRKRVEKSTLVYADPSDMAAFVAQAREAQIIDTHQYAQCLAMQKGVRIELADASFTDIRQWHADRAAAGLLEPPPIEEEVAFRNIKIVERLGATALTMQRTGWMRRSPILAMIVGDGHTKDIETLLDACGVASRSGMYSPDLYKRHLTALNYIMAIGEDPDVSAWVRNAQALTSRRS